MNFKPGDLVGLRLAPAVSEHNITTNLRRSAFLGIIVGEKRKKVFKTAFTYPVVWLTAASSSFCGRITWVVEQCLRKVSE